MNRQYIGIDLGSVNDYTALSIVERHGEVAPDNTFRQELRWEFQEYRLWHLERYLGESYTTIVDRILALIDTVELRNAQIVVDATGVGRPVIDLLKDRGLNSIIPVTITGGEAVTSDFVRGLREWRVPKRDLVGVLQVLLQNGALKIPATIELREELVSELQNFRVKLVAETGHAVFEHWRSGDHDDLVLSLALPLWLSEQEHSRLAGVRLLYI